MALKLILIRHCKFSWQDLSQDDHSRVLNTRGIHDAPKIGAWLCQAGHLPDFVLCSDAARAQETWQRIATSLPHEPPVTLTPALYLAPDLIMLEHLRRATTNVVAMVGHNPGIAEFAQNLVASPAKHPRFADYPTGATTVINFPNSKWTSLAENSGQVIDFVTPSDLN